MITQNYKKFLQACFTGETNISMISTSGSKKYFAPNANTFIAASYVPAKSLIVRYYPSSSSSYYGVYFGRGATPFSASDYTLEDPVSSSADLETVFPVSYRRIVDAYGKTLYTATYTLRNVSDTDIIINEIGLVASTYTSTSAGSSNATITQMLVDRTVLEEPLTIPVGEIRALTYNLEFDLNFE